MASPQNSSVFLLCFLLCIGQSKGSEEDKVTLTVYYEALCPYCSSFISRDLPRLFTDSLLPIVNLRLVPWGNADLDSSGSFLCQHGAAECLLNTVEACAITSYPPVETHFPFIQCIESLSYQQRESEWQDCFAAASLDPQPVYDCYNNGNGRQIELQYEYETAQLNPPHEYVPWVVVNDQPLGENYEHFVDYICKAYKGADTPRACASSQQQIASYDNEIVEADSTHRVCYVVGTLMNTPSNASLENLP